jgi:predicted RNA binding protein YcfA (HicA-like mRNA interferase family)
MTVLPVISGRDAVKAFQKAGWHIVNTQGSHVTLKKQGIFCNLSIPIHGNTQLKRGLLRKQIAKAEMTVEEFVVLLD